MPTEAWIAVPSFEGYYSVSDLGRVRSEARTITRRDGALIPIRSREMRQQANPKGYRFVHLSRGGQHTQTYISSLVLRAFVGPAPAGTEACHGNGDKTDNRLANLRWDTRSANNLDRVRHGTHNQAAKTHCPRNHPLREPNLVPKFLRSSGRVCRACYLAGRQVRRAERAGQPTPGIDVVADQMYDHATWLPDGESAAMPASVLASAPGLPHGDLEAVGTQAAPASVSAGQRPLVRGVAGEGFEPS